MKISIVTPSFNSHKTIAQAIDSVLSQDYGDLEYIVIDGASLDSTQDIILGYGDKITKFVSERDCGIYDAMNKGIQLASGDIVGILNSDDFYADCSVLSEVAQIFSSGDIDAVYADIDYVDAIETNIVVRKWRTSEYMLNAFRWGWHPPHPSFFVRRSVYEKYGYFKDILTISADYELMLRFLYFNKINFAYLPKVLVKMRVGGINNVSIASRFTAYKQDKMAWMLNGQKPPFGSILLKRLIKLKQWVV